MTVQKKMVRTRSWTLQIKRTSLSKGTKGQMRVIHMTLVLRTVKA